jgi:ubiquitin C-terminal hydrolase
MIRNSLQPEEFEADNLYFCSSCAAKVPKAVKFQEITKLPDYLFVTINRFYFDKTSKKREKICRPVAIPAQLCLNDCEYSLTGVVIHAGKSANFGHYYAIARGALNKWWLLNDTEVSLVADIHSFLTSLSQQFPFDTPYVVCYDRGTTTDV